MSLKKSIKSSPRGFPTVVTIDCDFNDALTRVELAIVAEEIPHDDVDNLSLQYEDYYENFESILDFPDDLLF